MALQRLLNVGLHHGVVVRAQHLGRAQALQFLGCPAIQLDAGLVGEAVAVQDLKLGPEVFVALAAELAPVCEVEATSISSQIWLNTSPFASEAVPVNINGVLLGIV